MFERGDCKKLAGFLSERLDLDDQLGFLFHVETCTQCWDGVYRAVKAQHPHFYRQTPSRRFRIPEPELTLELEEERVEVA